MKMLELYKALLSVGSLKADDEGMISAVMDGNSAPTMVDGKRLVLPTPQQQATAAMEGRVVFHPLSENVLRGESKVMEKFRGTINIRMNYVLQMIAQELLAIGVNVESHKRLNPDQAVLLTALKDADEKSLTALQALIKAMGLGNSDRCIVHIYLKRGGTVGGRKYPRAAIVTFPLYEELLKEDKHVYGVSISKKAKAVLRALFEFILPGIEIPNSYDFGSESDIAPFLDSLMQAVMKLAGAINTVVDNYEDFIDRAERYRYNDEWVETFENLGQLLPEIRAIPMQAGNEGAVARTPANPTAAAPALQNVNPAAAPAPAVMAMPPAPQMQGWPGMQPPAQQHPVAQPGQPALVVGAGGIDMASTLARNPQTAAMMAATAYGSGYMMPAAIPPGPVGARMGAPRWDQPVMMMANGVYMQQPMMPMQQPMMMAPMGVGPTGQF